MYSTTVYRGSEHLLMHIQKKFLGLVGLIYMQTIFCSVVIICCISFVNLQYTKDFLRRYKKMVNLKRYAGKENIFNAGRDIEIYMWGRICKIYSWRPPFTPPNPANFFFQSK
jgi:hypothetical protein